MSSVIFHVRGKKFRPEQALAKSKFKPYRVHHVGETFHAGETPKLKALDFVFENSGFSVDLGSQRGANLTKQIAHAKMFVKKHYSEIKRLKNADELRLDFGYRSRLDKNGDLPFVQCDFFPPDFLQLCGELHIGIELSLYQ